MKPAKPDIVLTNSENADIFVGADISVISPDGEYLAIVESTPKATNTFVKYAIERLKYLMASTNCSVGVVIAGERVICFRDSLEEYNGASIYLVGEAMLPNSLLPFIDISQQDLESGFAFLLQVRNWLENLKIRPNVDQLPSDLRSLLGESFINLIRWGEVRVGSFKKIKAIK
jgi:hypothetical protein